MRLAERIRSARTSALRKFSCTNWPRVAANWSFCSTISAVCGSGTPRGWRNRAVTANQSATPPTMAASAPACTKPRRVPWAPIAVTATNSAVTAARSAVARRRAAARRRARNATGSCPGAGTGEAEIVSAGSIWSSVSPRPTAEPQASLSVPRGSSTASGRSAPGEGGVAHRVQVSGAVPAEPERGEQRLLLAEEFLRDQSTHTDHLEAVVGVGDHIGVLPEGVEDRETVRRERADSTAALVLVQVALALEPLVAVRQARGPHPDEVVGHRVFGAVRAVR